jgi:Family of unknown function (DUF6961)
MMEPLGSVMDEIDIWRRAHLIVKQHEDGAAFFAAQRADELAAAGDQPGCEVWKKILGVIDALQRNKPCEGEAVN